MMAIERSASRLVRPGQGRRVRWFLGAWLAPALALGGCRAPSDAQFDVAVLEPASGAALVTVRLDGVPRDSLVLQAFASADFLRVDSLSVATEDGRDLPVRVAYDDVVVRERTLRLPRFLVAGPLPRRLVVRYRASIGARAGNAHTGFAGLRAGYLGSAFGLIRGRDLFLLPASQESMRSIGVRFQLPSGWVVITPWARRGGAFWPGIEGRYVAEHLVTASIGLGRFRETGVRVGSTEYRVAFESSIPESLSSPALETLGNAMRDVERWVGRGLGPTYTIVAVPDAPGGDEIEGEAWAAGQGGSSIPLTPGRLRTFTRRLLEAHLVHEPFRSQVRDPREYWLVDAVLNRCSWLAVARSGALQQLDLDRQQAMGYLGAMRLPDGERNLERLYDTDRKTRMTREAIAPFVLALLERELGRRSGRAVGLDGILPRVFSGKRARSIWDVLPGGSGAWRSFRERYVRGTEIASLREFALPTVKAQPIPRGGEPASHLTLIVTGNTHGFLENCGCKVNQSGGVARRATVLRAIRAKSPDALLIDAGNAFPRAESGEPPDFLSDEEQRLYLDIMSQAGFRASAVGRTELLFGSDHFRRISSGTGFPFLAANVQEHGLRLGPAVSVVTVGRRRVGLIGVYEPPTGPDAEPLLERSTATLSFRDPIRTLEEQAPALRRRADLIVAVGRLTPATIRRLAACCRDVDVVISTEDEAPIDTETEADGLPSIHDESGFVGPLLVLYTSLANYGLAEATLDLDRSGRIVGATSLAHWLNDRVADDPHVRAELNRFYDRVGRTEAAAASVAPPFADDAERMHGEYAGAARCASCHAEEFAQWKKTPHAGAFKTLLDRHRNFQPRCISCHVVAYGAPHGYRFGDSEKPLGNVQCEACHGPGAMHAAAPSATNIRRTVPEKVCLTCHTPDHSDGFVYAERLPKVRHDASPSLLLAGHP
jgi:cytochrome c554/c'-like protein